MPAPFPEANTPNPSDSIERLLVKLVYAVGESGGGGGGTSWGFITGTLSNQTDLQNALDAKANASHTHALSALTQSGASTGQVAQWNGSAWVPATVAGGGGAWGSITGILSAQTDLQNALNGKASTGAVGSSGITMATNRLLGRTTAGTGAVELITVGSGLTLSGGVLSVAVPPLPETPGTVTLSPQNSGMNYTMPSLPSNATSLRLEYSANGTSGWTTRASGLSGGASGTDTQGTANTVRYYRAVAVGAGGETAGAASNATTVALPAVAPAPNITGEVPGGTLIEAVGAADVARTAEMFLWVIIDGGEPQQLGNVIAATTHGPYDFTGATSIEAYLVCINNYGSTEGTHDTWSSVEPSEPKGPALFWKFNETAGSRSVSVGNDLHLVPTGSVGDVAGVVGGAVSIDNTSESQGLIGSPTVQQNVILDFPASAGRTIVFRVKLQDITTNQWLLGLSSEGVGSPNPWTWILGVDAGNYYLAIQDEFETFGIIFAAATVNTWQQVAFGRTADGNVWLKVGSNPRVVGDPAWNTNNSLAADKLFIGNIADYLPTQQSEVDMLGVWNLSLTDNELEWLRVNPTEYTLAVPAAPGLNPTASGVEVTMPSVALEAGQTYTLQKSDDGITWYDLQAGLDANDVHLDDTGASGGTPAGFANVEFWYRVKIVGPGLGSGMIGDADSVFTVALFGTIPTAEIWDGVSNGGSGIPGETVFHWPDGSSNTVGNFVFIELWYNIDSTGWVTPGNLSGGETENGPYDFTGATQIEVKTIFHNIYQSSESPVATWNA